MTDLAMKAFLSACGSSGPFVLGVEEPGAAGVSWRVFDQPFIVVGRDPAADLFLKDAEVSRRHAYLQLIAGRLFCVDLQSRTGTRWGDEPGLWGWVDAETGVRIGPFHLRTRGEGPGEALARDASLPVPVSRSFEQPDLPEVTLEILGESSGSPTWRVSRTLVLIGGSQACKVRLQGGGVSDIHASLLRTPSGVFAVDLLGRGGIAVNGKRARCVRIGENDELSVGPHRIRVRCGSPGTAAGLPPATGRREVMGRPGIPARDEDAGPGGLSIPSGPGGDPASLIRSMLDEFGQVQLQMADRFQESLMVVLRSFAGLHGEQMALIREELARIRELTEEQQALRSQAEGRAPNAADPPALRLVGGEPRSEPGGVSSGAAHPPRPPRPAVPPSRLTNGVKGERSEAADSAAPDADGTRPVPTGPAVPVDLHAQIVSRLAEIHEERQGRWQRLLKSLLN